jgi:uncharacterized protein YrrD
MNFVKGAEVFTATGEKIGTISRVVIDAKTRDVTDLVVEGGTLLRNEKVIPVSLVNLEKEDRIMLHETNQNIDDFPDYETTYYVPLEQAPAPYENVDAYYWYPPVNYQLPPGGLGLWAGVPAQKVPETETSIPEGRIAIAEGAQVISSDDKHIGNVEQVVADSETKNVTHFVVGKGFLLKEHKLVPSHWVTNVDEGKIYLSVEARVFDRMPDYQPQ